MNKLDNFITNRKYMTCITVGIFVVLISPAYYWMIIGTNQNFESQNNCRTKESEWVFQAETSDRGIVKVYVPNSFEVLPEGQFHWKSIQRLCDHEGGDPQKKLNNEVECSVKFAVLKFIGQQKAKELNCEHIDKFIDEQLKKEVGVTLTSSNNIGIVLFWKYEDLKAENP